MSGASSVGDTSGGATTGPVDQDATGLMGVECDPISPECLDSEMCATENPAGFSCQPKPPGAMEVGPGDACDGDVGPSICGPGYACFLSIDGESMCVPWCDTAQPQCPDGTSCLDLDVYGYGVCTTAA